MEPPTSFNLDHAVATWRVELARQPGPGPTDLRELETHLRESFAELRKARLTDAEAFLIARRRVGPAPAVAAEFAKASIPRFWRSRMFWLVGLAVFSAFIGYGIYSGPMYSAAATLFVVHEGSGAAPAAPGAKDDFDTESFVAFNGCLRLGETDNVARRVAARMTPAQKQAFLAPFGGTASSSDADLLTQLLRLRYVVPGRLAYTIQVGINHPDQQIAAIVADDYAQSLIDAEKELQVLQNGASLRLADNAATHVIQIRPQWLLLITTGLLAGLIAAFVVTAVARVMWFSHLRRPPAAALT